MNIRKEYVISLDKAWMADDLDQRDKDVILPEGTTDYIVIDDDGLELLYYVKDGEIFDEDHRKCGQLRNDLDVTKIILKSAS